MVNKSIIKTAVKYIRAISNEMDVKKAFLFGSYAKGEERENSDIDIAIVLDNFTDFFSVQMELMRFRRSIDLRIEPHPIKQSEFTNINPFAFEIKKNGIELILDDVEKEVVGSF